MSYNPEFSTLINTYLYKIDRNPSWLAAQLRVHPATVSRWLNDSTRPGNPEIVAKIADLLQIDKGQLLIAAGYGYVEAMELNSAVEPEPSVCQLLTFNTQAELQKYIRGLTQSFGEKLSEYSKQQGYTQLELAQHLNVSPAAVSQWRTGARIPNAKTVHKIIQALAPLSQDEIDQFLQAWTHSKLANDLSDYLVAASDDPMAARALEKLLQNL